MKKLSKKSDPDRKWRSFKKHARLLFRPLCFAFSATIVWNLAHENGFCFSQTDGSDLIGGTAVIIGFVYAMLAGWLLSDVFGTYKKAVLAVLTKDKRTFLFYRDERLPINLHLLVMVCSFPLFIIIGGLNYEYFWAGFTSVFWVALIFGLYLGVITELQNFSKSLWFAERIPKEWLDEDVDKFFKLGEETEKKG